MLEQISHLIHDRIKNPDKLFVLKFTVDAWVGGVTSYENNKIVVHKLIWHPFEKKIDPNHPSLDIELLQDSLAELVDEHNLAGYDVAFALPSSIAELRMLSVPFELNQKVDRKEFAANSKEKLFWQEFDPEIVDLKFPVFSYQFLAQAEEEGSSLIYASWTDQRSINMCVEFLLSAKLYPIFIVPETQAIYNNLFSQLDRLEKESFFGILHLAAGRSQLMVSGPERFVRAKINISELDEVLLEDIEAIDLIEGPFWEEVGARVGNSLKQAFLYLKEEERIPIIRNIYVISESSKFANTFTLLKQNFNLSNLKAWPQSLDFSRVMIDGAEEINNKALFESALGLGFLKINRPTIDDQEKESDSGLIHLNLQPQINNISGNRRLVKISKIFYGASIVLIIFSALWTLTYLLPAYLVNQSQFNEYQKVDQELGGRKKEIDTIDALISKYDGEIAALESAKRGASKSRFMTLLPKIIPSGVELDSFEINPENIVITGRAISGSAAQNLYHAIAVNELGSNLGVIIDRETPLSTVVRFKIVGKPYKVEVATP